MLQPVDFYFEFASPYGYLASRRIDEIGARYDRVVTWRPFLLGAVFKVVGTGPMFDYPLKSDYFLHDFPRSARRMGISATLPPGAPHNTIAAARAFTGCKTMIQLSQRRSPDVSTIDFLRTVRTFRRLRRPRKSQPKSARIAKRLLPLCRITQ